MKRLGMTLLEVMIALFIFTILVGSVFGVFLVTRQTGLSSLAFTEARQIGQSETERLYAYSATTNYSDTLYLLINKDGYTCTGFTWNVDATTGDITYNPPANPVTCTRTQGSYKIDLNLSQNTTVSDTTLKNILIRVFSLSESGNVRRYETLYATEFQP